MSYRTSLRFLICFAGFWIPLDCQNVPRGKTSDPYVRIWTGDLTARLKWEVLWKQTPEGFKLPADGSARLELDRLIGKFISYCSHDLGVCARYRLDERRLTELVDSAICTGHETDSEALAHFVGSGREPTSAAGTIGGVLGGGGRMTMKIRVEIGDRERIAEYYRKQRPVELDGLVEWVTKEFKGHHKSVRIPCFLKSDPQIFIYGELLKSDPVIVAVTWNPDIEEWEGALFAGPPEEKSVIDEWKLRIESLSCAEVRLN